MEKFVQTVCIAILNSDYEKRSHASSLFPPVIMVGPIYQLADIFGRYRYTGIGKWNICIGYSGDRLYRYRPNIGLKTWISAKIAAYKHGYWQEYRHISV